MPIDVYSTQFSAVHCLLVVSDKCVRMCVCDVVGICKKDAGIHKNFRFDYRRNHYPVCGYLVAPEKCMYRSTVQYRLGGDFA